MNTEQTTAPFPPTMLADFPDNQVADYLRSRDFTVLPDQRLNQDQKKEVIGANFTTNLLIDYLAEEGYSVGKSKPKSAWETGSIQDDELIEVLDEAYKKYGYGLVDMIRNL